MSPYQILASLPIILCVVLALMLHQNLATAQVCRNAVNTSLFEYQLSHLNVYDMVIQIRNISYDIDNALCDRPFASPLELPQRSVCPWEVDEDYNENRYPSRLFFARCRCTRCLGNNECRPVYYRIPVLEKKCVDGIMQYVSVYVRIPVGCICVRPLVISVRKRLLQDILQTGLVHKNHDVMLNTLDMLHLNWPQVEQLDRI